MSDIENLIHPIDVDGDVWYEVALPNDIPHTFPSYMLAVGYINELMEMEI